MESNSKGEIKLRDIAPTGLPCALLAAEGRQTPDSHVKLSKFIKLPDFKTLCRSQGLTSPSHQRLKNKKYFVVWPKLISGNFAGGTKRRFLENVWPNLVPWNRKFSIKRNVVLERTLWFSPHCFSWHTWSIGWNKPCNIRIFTEESGRACNGTFRLIWIDKWNILLLFPLKCRIFFASNITDYPFSFIDACQNTNKVNPNVKRKAVSVESETLLDPQVWCTFGYGELDLPYKILCWEVFHMLTGID